VKYVNVAVVLVTKGRNGVSLKWLDAANIALLEEEEGDAGEEAAN
jgi:hypothetical protein